MAHPHNSQGYPSGDIPSSERILLSHHNTKDLEVCRKYFSTNLLFNSVRYVMKHCLLFDIMLFHNFSLLLCRSACSSTVEQSLDEESHLLTEEDINKLSIIYDFYIF